MERCKNSNPASPTSYPYVYQINYESFGSYVVGTNLVPCPQGPGSEAGTSEREILMGQLHEIL